MQNTSLIATITSKLNPEQAKAFNDALSDMTTVVDKIEASPETTKDRYDRYLPITKSKIAVMIAMCAGGNKDGILAAARINGVA